MADGVISTTLNEALIRPDRFSRLSDSRAAGAARPEDPATARSVGEAAAEHAVPGSHEAAGASERSARPISDKLELSPEARAQVARLQQTDAEVRAHEAAHSAAGGALAGAPRFSYQQGPDGRAYAVGGEVPIRVEKGATPEETLRIANQVRGAALAPANPSSADAAVAASATSLQMEAQREIAAERRPEGGESEEAPSGDFRVQGYEAQRRTSGEPTDPAVDRISFYG